MHSSRRDLPVARLDLVICAHQNFGQNLFSFLSFVPAGPLSFRRSDSLRRRIDHLLDPSQSPQFHDAYRQKNAAEPM
jgi:hypothetical protein